MLTHRIPLLLAVAALLGTAACGGASGGTGGGSGDTKVVGAFYPMAWLAERVGDDRVKVSQLTRPGTEPHDLELTPRQIAEVGESDYIVYVKGVQPAVDEAVEQRAKDHALDAAGTVRTIPAPAEDEHGQEGGEHGHDEPSYDPHLWLDPSRMAAVAHATAGGLGKADPGGRDAYRAGAARLAGELTKLDGEYRAGLRSCKQKTLVTAHAAFGYLADRYGLRQVSIAGIDPRNEPSPAKLAGLTREIKASGATTVFTETLVSPKVARTLAREAGVRTATLDPIEGVAEGSRDDYFSIMRRNLQNIRTALGCS